MGDKITQINLWARGAVILFYSVALRLDGLGKDDRSSCFFCAQSLPALNPDFFFRSIVILTCISIYSLTKYQLSASVSLRWVFCLALALFNFCLLSALPAVLYTWYVPGAEPTHWMGSKGELDGGICNSSDLVGLMGEVLS